VIHDPPRFFQHEAKSAENDVRLIALNLIKKIGIVNSKFGNNSFFYKLIPSAQADGISMFQKKCLTFSNIISIFSEMKNEDLKQWTS
jgi:hypothetical protein